MKRKVIFQGDAFEDFIEWARLDRKIPAKVVTFVYQVNDTEIIYCRCLP